VNQFSVAGDIVKELSAQEIDTRSPQIAGGWITQNGSSTVGRVCTLSWECQLRFCAWW
jgi:hypothetical protein